MPVELTSDDWAEIYFSLETKKSLVESGQYADPCEDKKWTAHIGAIMAKIGPDGEDAAAGGVSPSCQFS